METKSETDRKVQITPESTEPSSPAGPMTVEEVLTAALDIGERMLECGAAANRVEDAIARICGSYGVKDVEVFSISSFNLVSAAAESGHTITKTRRIYSTVTNLHQLELLNALSRFVCEHRPTRAELEKKREELLAEDQSIAWLSCLGYFFATGSLAVFFGGTVWDGLASALVSLFIFFCNRRLKRKEQNQIVYTLLATAAAGTLAILLVGLGIGVHVDKVMIGDILVFIPGLVMVNSIRDMLYGDIMTGVFRLLEALLVTLAIVCGMALSLLVFDGLLPPQTWEAEDGGHGKLVRLALAFVTTLSFALFFNIKKERLWYVAVLGTLVNAAYLFFFWLSGGKLFAATFAASVLATFAAELSARWKKAPGAVFLLPAVITLIPGSRLYYTMSALVHGNHEQFLSEGNETVLSALGLSGGILIASVFFQQAIKAVRRLRSKRRL